MALPAPIHGDVLDVVHYPVRGQRKAGTGLQPKWNSGETRSKRACFDRATAPSQDLCVFRRGALGGTRRDRTARTEHGEIVEAASRWTKLGNRTVTEWTDTSPMIIFPPNKYWSARWIEFKWGFESGERDGVGLRRLYRTGVGAVYLPGAPQAPPCPACGVVEISPNQVLWVRSVGTCPLGIMGILPALWVRRHAFRGKGGASCRAGKGDAKGPSKSSSNRMCGSMKTIGPSNSNGMPARTRKRNHAQQWAAIRNQNPT
jgi:hypothetical protein